MNHRQNSRVNRFDVCMYVCMYTTVDSTKLLMRSQKHQQQRWSASPLPTSPATAANASTSELPNKININNNMTMANMIGGNKGSSSNNHWLHNASARAGAARPHTAHGARGGGGVKKSSGSSPAAAASGNIEPAAGGGRPVTPVVAGARGMMRCEVGKLLWKFPGRNFMSVFDSSTTPISLLGEMYPSMMPPPATLTC